MLPNPSARRPSRLHAIALACLAGPTLAQTTETVETTEPARSAGIVTIAAARTGTLPTSIPATLEGVEAKTIDATINATDSADALKYLPSLLVRKRCIGDYDHAVLSARASGTGDSARSLAYADGSLLSSLLGNGASFTPHRERRRGANHLEGQLTRGLPARRTLRRVRAARHRAAAAGAGVVPGAAAVREGQLAPGRGAGQRHQHTRAQGARGLARGAPGRSRGAAPSLIASSLNQETP